jgi:tRNA G18 (ribose-2'-O)-methylase SpoU
MVTLDKKAFDIDFTTSTVVIRGQEGAGLLRTTVDIDLRVRIPMAAATDLLTLAKAAAVVLYEAMKQRLQQVALSKTW